MKMYLINALTMLMVVISFQVNGRLDSDFSELSQMQMLKSSPTFQIDAVSTVTLKSFVKFNHIAQDFFPIVTIAESNPFDARFFHYDSVYKLHREKDYFLLI
jgi:hypothetical protein